MNLSRFVLDIFLDFLKPAGAISLGSALVLTRFAPALSTSPASF